MYEGKSSPANLVWRRPGECESFQCVEVAFTDEGVLVRHSGQPQGPLLAFDHAEWRVFLAAVRSGEFTV